MSAKYTTDTSGYAHLRTVEERMRTRSVSTLYKRSALQSGLFPKDRSAALMPQNSQRHSAYHANLRDTPIWCALRWAVFIMIAIHLEDPSAPSSMATLLMFSHAKRSSCITRWCCFASLLPAVTPERHDGQLLYSGYVAFVCGTSPVVAGTRSFCSQSLVATPTRRCYRLRAVNARLRRDA